ncbi:uncharacterized protein LOC128475005 [Spea bombifrons]|uniref:uncharacterized protein LOC128475005 n=1 Tax=Spea bombifrons TaxID=233779 RepID=UPI00234B5D0A|nr:uncharacterized protein LOC128475005 [Spea bombifrons]
MSAERGALQFSEWDTGKRRLRYLYIRSPCAFTLCHAQQAEENLIPMFLGADVVAQTGIRTENHPKLHAKFAKKGLAAKLTFSPDFKFEKLRLPSGVNTLWFYSIQGVFRVAFDLYSRDDQLAVIESLQELWRSRLKDSPLKKCYNLKERLENTDHVAQICSHADQPRAQEQLVTWSSDFIHKGPNVLHSIPAFGTVTEHNYCKSNTSHPPEATSSDVIVRGARNVLDMCTDTVIQLSEQSKTAVLMLFDVICQMLKGQQYMDKMIVSIVQLLDAASYMFDKNSSQKEIPSVYDNKLLLEVSSWLGNRFQSEYECISQQVEEFKRKHIDRISDLPPAEELVSALFPKAMKILLLNWMGLSDEAFVSKLQSEYPILLLILEFANRNLITGVAHVLYSTLICK